MKTLRLHKWTCLWLCLLAMALACATGCSSDDSSSSTMQSGTILVPANRAVRFDVGVAPANGTLIGTATWEGGNAVAFFFREHGVSRNLGWVYGESPLNTTVPDVAEGTSLMLFIGNQNRDDIRVRYSVRLDPS